MDSPPCSSSSSCYALTTPVVLHSTKGLLTLISGAFKASDNTYLAKSSNLNNQFVPNANIALNAIGKDYFSNYYSSSLESYNFDTIYWQILPSGNISNGCSSPNDKISISYNPLDSGYLYQCTSNTYFETSKYSFAKGTLKFNNGIQMYSVIRYLLIF